MSVRGPMFGAVRVRTRVRRDGPSLTWEGWDTSTGERVLLRAWPEAPAEAWVPLTRATSAGDDRRVALRSLPFVCSLADLDPRRFVVDDAAERGPVALVDPPSTAWSATVLLSVLHALVPIHAAGHTHGWVGPRSVVATREGWTLLWLGPVDAPTDDLRALATLLPIEDPLTELVAGFAEHPPPSVADAARIVLRSCADLLAAEHHALVFRARELGRNHARTRLAALVHRLDALPPPAARGELPVEDGALEVVSAGGHVRAARGPRGGPFDQGFDVYGPAGLDAVATRAVLRAAGAAPPAALAALLRWLVAASSLRTDRMLLERGR
jgi:hypothetical protein